MEDGKPDVFHPNDNPVLRLLPENHLPGVRICVIAAVAGKGSAEHQVREAQLLAGLDIVLGVEIQSHAREHVPPIGMGDNAEAVLDVGGTGIIDCLQRHWSIGALEDQGDGLLSASREQKGKKEKVRESVSHFLMVLSSVESCTVRLSFCIGGNMMLSKYSAQLLNPIGVNTRSSRSLSMSVVIKSISFFARALFS